MRRALLLSLLLGIGALVAPMPRVSAQSGPLPDGIGIRLTEAPTDRRDDPRALVYIVDHVQPGTSISRGIELSNGTEDTATLELYTVPAQVVDGRFVPQEGRATSPLVAWTRMEPARVVLEPGTTTPARITIDVPEDAPDGERYGVALASLPPQGEESVAVTPRVGIRIYLSVGTGAEPPSDFTVASLTAARDDEGRPVVHTTVENTGQRALDLSGELELDDGPGGLSAGPFLLERGTTLAPGDSAPVRVVLDAEIPAGPWNATVTMRSGELVRVAEAVITFPEDAGTEAPPVAATPADEAARRVAVPVAVTALLLVLLGLLLLLWYRRRRRSRDDEDAPVVPA